MRFIPGEMCSTAIQVLIESELRSIPLSTHFFHKSGIHSCEKCTSLLPTQHFHNQEQMT